MIQLSKLNLEKVIIAESKKMLKNMMWEKGMQLSLAHYMQGPGFYPQHHIHARWENAIRTQKTV
jgi:hypothetical protein